MVLALSLAKEQKNEGLVLKILHAKYTLRRKKWQHEQELQKQATSQLNSYVLHVMKEYKNLYVKINCWTNFC